jgi:hypothetical protein
MKKRISTGIVTCAFVLAIACVTANTLTVDTPLYTYRMEHVSSQMNFLPTEANEFSYNSQDYCLLSYSMGCTMGPLDYPTTFPCQPTEETCLGSCGGTCSYTCKVTECESCSFTCGSTCITC